MAEKRLSVTHTGTGMVMEARTSGGIALTVDGDGEAGASPMELLLAATGACALVDVDIILRKKRLVFSDLRVECVGTRPDEGTPKPYHDIRLVFSVKGDVPAKAFDDAVRLSVEKYCSVGETVRKGAPVRYEARVG